MNLEERVEEEIENNSESQGIFQRLIKNRWMRRFVLPVAATTSMFFGTSRQVQPAVTEQVKSLAHDPILLIHGLDLSLIRTPVDYADFDGVRKIEGKRVVDFDDFFLFAEKYGTRKGDGKYDSGFDLDRNEKIDIDDFFKFSDYFGQKPEPLEETWDILSDALTKDLKWIDGGTVGEWVPSSNLKAADFYKLRLTSGNRLDFNKQGDEVKLAVDKINEVTKKKVILAGFSMGGLAARAYLQNNPDPKTSALVTICTPHSGSYLAFLPEKTEVSKWVSANPFISWVPEAGDFFINYLTAGKPAIKYLQPCSTEVVNLNNNLYRMPTNILYTDIISQLPNQSLLNQGLNLINKYKDAYKKCQQLASEGELAKGDGVVSTVSQLLRNVARNSPNIRNLEWYEKVKNNIIPENAEMEVFHTKGNKQTAILKKVLEDVIEKIEKSSTQKSSKIAFESFRDGNHEIYIMNPDGSNQARLTNNSGSDLYPSWSPDGSKIAFRSNRDGNWEIYVMNPDGSNQARLTNNSGSDTFPSWSPDGSKIAFRSTREGMSQIYVMHSDGSNQKRLTNNSISEGPDLLNDIPYWSSDGRKIVFSSFRDGNHEIYVMNADGSNQKRLTNNSILSVFPSWSTDGTRIAFESTRDGNYEIYVMNPDGSNQINLTNHPAADISYSWSPDGSKIAFESYRNENDEIYIMNADGSNLKRLTNNSTRDRDPSWSPDGSKIAFRSNRDGNWEIYIMNPDGSNQINLTNNLSEDEHPSWSPPSPPSNPTNHPPNKPSNPSPKHLATNVPLEVLLDWEGSDPNGDSLKYTVYFEKDDSTPDQVFKSNLSESEIKVSNLENNVNYYWQIVASDGKLTTAGDVWSFKTRDKWDELRNKIFFSVDKAPGPGKGELWMINPDGSNAKIYMDKVTSIAFSRNGNKVTFNVDNEFDESKKRGIYVMDIDGSNKLKIGEGRGPDISLDGNKVVFQNNYEIYLFDFINNSTKQLTNDKYQDGSPSFSFDEKTILFLSDRFEVEEYQYQLVTMDLDGKNVRRLSKDDYRVVSKSLSPDGRYIAYTVEDKNGDGKTWVMNYDGTNKRQLSKENQEEDPSWSPDSRKIIFSKFMGRIGDEPFKRFLWEIFSMNSDGSNVVRLTYNPSAYTQKHNPIWSPP